MQIQYSSLPALSLNTRPAPKGLSLDPARASTESSVRDDDRVTRTAQAAPSEVRGAEQRGFSSEVLEELVSGRVAQDARAEHAGEQEEEHGDRNEVRKGLHDVRKIVKNELKALANVLKDLEDEGLGENETHELRQELKDLTKTFEGALKDIGKGIKHGAEYGVESDPRQILSSVREAFENLASGLASIFGTNEEPPSGSEVEAPGSKAQTLQSPLGALITPGASSPTGQTSGSDAQAEPVEPVAPGQSLSVSNLAEAEEPAISDLRSTDLLGGLRGLVSSLVDGFDSILSGLSERLAEVLPKESDEDLEIEGEEHELLDQEHAAVIGPQQSNVVDAYVSIQLSIQVSFGFEFPGSRLNLAG